MINRRAAFILRLALAFVFFYAAISAFSSPENWIGFFPRFLLDIFPAWILLMAFSVSEIILAAWLLSGKLIRWSSLISAALLAGVVVFNLGAMDIVFRDVGLASAAVALFELSRHPEP